MGGGAEIGGGGAGGRGRMWLPMYLNPRPNCSDLQEQTRPPPAKQTYYGGGEPASAKQLMFFATCSFNSYWEHSHRVSVYRNNCREQLKQKDYSVRVLGARFHLPLFAQLLESSVVATAPVEIGVTLLDFGRKTVHAQPYQRIRSCM